MSVSAPATVTVVVDGRRIDATDGAYLDGATVVGPLVPFVREVSSSVDRAGAKRFTIVRGARRIEVAVGSPDARDDGRVERLPVAPFERDGTTFMPLGAIARALGASVAYDPRARTMTVTLVPVPVATMTPFAGYVPPPPPLPTFAPKATPVPQATITGIPRPRRTPILVDPDRRA